MKESIPEFMSNNHNQIQHIINTLPDLEEQIDLLLDGKLEVRSDIDNLIHILGENLSKSSRIRLIMSLKDSAKLRWPISAMCDAS